MVDYAQRKSSESVHSILGEFNCGSDTIGEQSHRYSIIAVVCMWVNNASSSNRIHEFIPTVAYVVSIVHALVLKTVDVRICLYDSRSSVLMNVSDKSP